MISHRGLRHLALRVADVERAKEFYMRVFGMRVVWQPDAENAYLSSGCDNLALHRSPADSGSDRALDHLGFIVPTIAEVEQSWNWTRDNGVEVVQPLRHHRDGSVSFYVRDPDGNVIQVLYEPSISSLEFTRQKA